MRPRLNYNQQKDFIDTSISDKSSRKYFIEFLKQRGIPHGFEHYPPLVHFLKENNLISLLNEASEKYHFAKRPPKLKDPSRWSILDINEDE